MIQRLRHWLRWQLPYVAFCYAYFPVTLTKQVLLRGKRGYLGLDPLARRFWDKWGFLRKDLMEFGRQRPVWINLNSGGEVVIGWGLLKGLNVKNGPYVLSTESYDGHLLLHREFGSTRSFFPPWDLGIPVHRVLNKLTPRALVFVQNAYFPNLLREARRRGIQTILVNGLFSRNVAEGNPTMQRALALRFQHQLDVVAVQDEADYRIAQEWGIPKERLTITGDMYADLRHLRLLPQERAAWRRELGFTETEPILVVGSTHPQEEEVVEEILQHLKKMRPDLKFLVAPRQIDEAPGMFKRFSARGWRVARRSQLPNPSQPKSSHEILLLDTFGELRRLFGIADVVYVGASLVPLNERRAGHNILEPLVHGVIPVFGPHMGLWRHVVDPILRAEPALKVTSPEAVARQTVRILEGKVNRQGILKVTEETLDIHGGAVERTLSFLKQRLGN